MRDNKMRGNSRSGGKRQGGISSAWVRAPGNFLLASCLEINDGPNTTAIDATALSVGQSYFYLTRAENACPLGTGSLGTNSSGTLRVGVDCP